MRRLTRAQILFVLAAALQIIVVLGFAGAREALLRRGTEIMLATVLVDPRDLLRGDYVVLRYEISTVDLCFGPVGSAIYVPLEKDVDVYVQLASRRMAPAESVEQLRSRHDGLFLKGRIESTINSPGGEAANTCEVSYGIENYFVPEGTGREIERELGDIRMRVTVDGEGRAAIIGLEPPEPDVSA